ncbi:hypothetical protein N5C52_24375, partial [Pseudomonas mosselii]|uniref:hypothetical protein n=1 Tax=Pseudomonas mosselii TaxID=78327 RepID=UPI002449AC01
GRAVARLGVSRADGKYLIPAQQKSISQGAGEALSASSHNGVIGSERHKNNNVIPEGVHR